MFAEPDALPATSRLELAGLLAVPGRSLAILPGQLARLPLPADPPTWAAVRAAIESGLTSAVLSTVADHRLDTLVPALHGCDDSFIRALPTALGETLQARANGTAVTALTVRQISAGSGFGPRRVAAIVAAAVAAGLALVARSGDERGPPPTTLDDLVTVLAQDAARGDVLRRRLADLVTTGPADVSAAAGRIPGLPISTADRCLEFLEVALAAAGDQRDRGLFEHGVLPLGPAVPRAELVTAVGVGPERVRQLIVRATERVDRVVAGAPPAVVSLATRVAGDLGAAAPPTAITALLTVLGLPPLPDPRSLLLVRMAGDYRPVPGHPGWVALDPAELLAETRRMIHEDEGVRLVDQVANELRSFGLRNDHVEAWLARQPVRVDNGLVVVTTGSTADVAERALHASGRPLGVDELATWVPGGWDGADALWSGGDRRFTVTEHDALALAEWDDCGKPAAMQITPTWRVIVDPDVLAGGGGVVSTALAHAIGLGRGSRRTLATRYGPLPLHYDGATPAHGSIRPVALAVGAAVGDELLVTLYPDRDGADVSLVRSARPAPAAS